MHKVLARSRPCRSAGAHFGVLCQHAKSHVRLPPIFGLITTTFSQTGDVLALTLCGSQRWPNAKTSIALARSPGEMCEARNRLARAEVAHGVQMARQQMGLRMPHTPRLKEIGQMMLAPWAQGMGTSLQS